MNSTIHSPERDPNTEPTSSGGIPEGIYPFQHEENITEGSEFLDDAIRTKEQPLGELSLKRDE